MGNHPYISIRSGFYLLWANPSGARSESSTVLHHRDKPPPHRHLLYCLCLWKQRKYKQRAVVVTRSIWFYQLFWDSDSFKSKKNSFYFYFFFFCLLKSLNSPNLTFIIWIRAGLRASGLFTVISSSVWQKINTLPTAGSLAVVWYLSVVQMQNHQHAAH